MAVSWVEKNGVRLRFQSDGQNDGFWRSYPAWEADSFHFFDVVAASQTPPHNNVLDVGAWIGPTALYFARRFAKVWAVEADTVAMRALSANVAVNPDLASKISIIPRAVYKTTGKVAFGPNKFNADSKLNDSCSQVHDVNGTHQHPAQSVPCISFNDLISIYRIRDLALIKVDIEGGEEFIIAPLLQYASTNKVPIYLSFHHAWWANPSDLANHASALAQFHAEIFDKSVGRVVPCSDVIAAVRANPFVSVLLRPKDKIENRRLRIAVCMSGFLRTAGGVAKQSLVHFVQNRHDVDVFVHTYRENLMQKDSSEIPDERLSDTQIQDILHGLNVRALVVEDRQNAAKFAREQVDELMKDPRVAANRYSAEGMKAPIRESSDPNAPTTLLAYRVYDQMRKIFLSYKLAATYPCKYDIVMRIRPDLLLMEEPKWQLALDNPKVAWSGQGVVEPHHPDDLIAIGVPQVMQVYSERFLDLMEGRIFSNCAHQSLPEALALRGMQLKPGAVEYRVMRTDTLCHVVGRGIGPIDPPAQRIINLLVKANVRNGTTQLAQLQLLESFEDIGRREGTDKIAYHGYHRFYPLFLEHLRGKAVRMLEIGVGEGRSLRTWLSYFPHGFIYGLEIDAKIAPKPKPLDRFEIIVGDQSKSETIDKIVSRFTNEPLDLAIDDGSHVPIDMLTTFNVLFASHALKDGGIYVLEDTETSYWRRGHIFERDFVAGHASGRSVVDAFKAVVDADLNRDFMSPEDRRQHAAANPALALLSLEARAKISTVTFCENMIVVTKARADDSRFYGRGYTHR